MAAPAGGRLVAWAGFLFGSVMSIAANILHTWIPKPPEGAAPDWVPPADWAPSVAAQIGAAVWPVGLLISVEVLSRVQWPDTFGWNFARYGGAGTVAVGSAVISYGHLHEVLVAWDYTWIGALVGPLVLDGLMVVSGFALLAMAQRQEAVDEKPQTSREQAPKTEPAPEPAPEPPNTLTSAPEPAPLHAVGDPKPWSERAQELMKQGVSRATAYRRARKEFESVSA